MLFNVEMDSGDRIAGYVVPDAFSLVPRIRVSAGEVELLVFEANDRKEALVHAGRHETGQCGFIIDTSLVPDLASRSDLALHDAESGLLLYRRAPPQPIAQKIIRLETHLMPLWRLDDALRSRFQYFARGVENFGRETVTQLFLLTNVDSVWLSGRLLYKSYAYFIESGFKTVILLQEPYAELAERLLVLSKISAVGLEHLDMRDRVGLRAAAAYASQLPFAEPRELKRALRQMPGEVAATFANPLVRQLTTSTPDEMPGGGAIASALDLLSAFAVVGLRHEESFFRATLAELLETRPNILPSLPQYPSVEQLARTIRETAAVDDLLEKDRELYHFVVEAFAKTPQKSDVVE